MRDKYCENCIHLSITEEDQNKYKDKPNHMCLACNIKVWHMGHEPEILRCQECLHENLKNTRP